VYTGPAVTMLPSPFDVSRSIIVSIAPGIGSFVSDLAVCLWVVAVEMSA